MIWVHNYQLKSRCVIAVSLFLWKISIMINDAVAQKLNEQIQYEAYASQAYLSLATWAEIKNFDGIAQYLYAASEDERAHMLQIYKYINLQGGEAKLKDIKEHTKSFKNLLEVFEYVFELEHDVTINVNELVDFCQKQKDFATVNFLQAFVAEQQESENSVLELIHMIKTLGYDDRNAFFINKQFKKLVPALSKPTAE